MNLAAIYTPENRQSLIEQCEANRARVRRIIDYQSTCAQEVDGLISQYSEKNIRRSKLIVYSLLTLTGGLILYSLIKNI